MIRKIFTGAALAVCALGAMAENETMYLIKGDRVVGKYAVDDVDYATFRLPENVVDQNVWLTVEKVGKNEVTYTVNTANPNIAYAHNLVSFYDANYVAMDYFGESFDALDADMQKATLQYALRMGAYVGIDTKTYTQHDFAFDGTGIDTRFSVIPGTKYFLCAWEVDAATQSPGDAFTFTELETLAPGKSNAKISLSQGPENDHGVVINFEADDNVYYVRTAWGKRSVMDQYVAIYGLDFLLGTFGQSWTIDFLNGTGDFNDATPNSTWSTSGAGEYVMFCRAYDGMGDIVDVRLDVDVLSEMEVKGPEITVINRSKGNGNVSLSFEITPSNVDEAYVRLCEENWVDDRLNMGYELHEIAAGGDATDITSEINNFGEYTFTASGLDQVWYSIVVTAKTKEGKRTSQRFNFNTFAESHWADGKPVYKTPARRLPPAGAIRRIGTPTIAR